MRMSYRTLQFHHPQNENESGNVDKYHMEALIHEIRVLVFGVTTTWELFLTISAESVAILMVMFCY